MPTKDEKLQSQITFPCRKTRHSSRSTTKEFRRGNEATRTCRDSPVKRKASLVHVKDKENSLPSPQKPLRVSTPFKELQCSPPKRPKDEIDTPAETESNPRTVKCKLFQEDSDCSEYKSTKCNAKKGNGIVEKPHALSGKAGHKICTSDQKTESQHAKVQGRNSVKLSTEQPNLRPYRRAAQCLHTSLPPTMPCRDHHLLSIKSFIKEKLDHKTSGSLYVSGAPGTGKTSCVMKVIEELQDTGSCDFHVVLVNCMSIKQSHGIYEKMLNSMTDKDHDGINVKDAKKKFMKELKKEKKIVLVLDEIDQLDTREHDVLYQIFELPSLPKSQLVLIGIANSLDLTDRILPRLQSMPKQRPTAIQFSPYSKDEIQRILMDRLAEEPLAEQVIDPKAVQLCARKVASVAGDARKALDILRRAIEKVEAETRKQMVLSSSRSDCPEAKKVTLSHVLSVCSEVYGSRFSANNDGRSMSFPLQQKVLICTLLLLTQDGINKEITAKKLLEGYTKVCRCKQITPIGQGDFFDLCTILESRGVINLKKSKVALTSKVSLRLQFAEVSFALQDQTLLSSIMSINRATL